MSQDNLKRYRVLIRGTLGDQEEYWDLTEEQVKASLDADGNVYALRNYEEGKQVTTIVPKWAWTEMSAEYHALEETAESKTSSNDKYPPVDIEKLRAGLYGKPIHLLVEAHCKKAKGFGSGAKKKYLIASLRGTINMLSPPVQALATDFADRWVNPTLAHDRSFWDTGSDEILFRITEDVSDYLKSLGLVADSETRFNLFQIVLLSWAYLALDQPNILKFIKG
jgi:hypothetical protein